jgi:hypothetical protein
MNWAVGVTTAPRLKSTLRRTIESLGRAGWPRCCVFEDTDRKGAWPNWLDALGTLLDHYPTADAIMLVQDDAIFCRCIRPYLEATLWPARDAALCSPYCPAPYRRQQRGWHQENRGWFLVGAVCWAIPRESAVAIVRDLGQVQAKSRIDARVGQWAQRTGRSVWYHTPSLVQHAGNNNSALGDPSTDWLRSAADFIGEDAQP